MTTTCFLKLQVRAHLYCTFITVNNYNGPIHNSATATFHEDN